MTALDSAGAIVRDLFIDALLFLPLLPPRPLKVADIGAGAGIPGLPLSLADPSIAVVVFLFGLISEQIAAAQDRR